MIRTDDAVVIVRPQGQRDTSMRTDVARNHQLAVYPVRNQRFLIVYERAKRLYAQYQANSDQMISCNDVRMMRSLIRGGAGIGMLSLIDVTTDVDAGRLAFVRLLGRQAKPLTLGLCIAPPRQLSQAAQMVIDRLAAALALMSDPSRERR